MTDIIENSEGTANVQLNISDDFIKWFKKDQGLKRWSQKRFDKWVAGALKEGLKMMEER